MAILASLICLSVTFGAHADEPIENYLRSGGDIAAVNALPSSIDLIEKLMSESNWGVLNSDREVRARARRLVTIAAGKVEGSTVQLPVRAQRIRMEEALDLALRLNPRAGETRQSLWAVADRLALWTPRHLWYFLAALKRSDGIYLHSTRLFYLMPHLARDHRQKLAEALRAVRPSTPLTFALLLDTGRGRKRDLIRLLGLTSRQFARAIARRGPLDDPSFRQERLEDPRRNIVAEKLSEIARALNQDDAALESAFDIAVEEAATSRPSDYERRDRVLFFQLLYENRLDWRDRASWIHQALVDRHEERPPRLRSLYRVEGNIILVKFGARRHCQRLLE